MDLIKKINKWSLFALLVAILSCGSTVTQAKTKILASKSPWEESYNYEHNKKYVEAANVLKPILDKTPNDEFALIRMGWLNYLQGKYNASFDFYKKALDVNSDSIDARLGLTLPLMAQLRWKEAAVYANQVISISTWDFTANTRLMICESGQSQWEVLEKHAVEFIKRYPSDATGFVFLARAQAMQGKKDDAIANYKEALDRAPTNAEALKYLENKK